MNEGLLPFAAALFDQRELEEERRACYVAITRAQTRLYMTHSRTRSTFGDTEAQTPSRFIKEIPAQYLRHWQEEKDRWGRITWQEFTVKKTNPVDIPQSKLKYSQKFPPYAQPKVSSYKTPTAHRSAQSSTTSKPKIKPNLNIDWKIGDNAKHGKWGMGKVVDITGEGDKKNITIAFSNPEVGQKTLKLAVAPIEKV